jgi:hypothetical protein
MEGNTEQQTGLTKDYLVFSVFGRQKMQVTGEKLPYISKSGQFSELKVLLYILDWVIVSYVVIVG